ncbi:MAG: PLP-dependent aspartate aminotransferase family protein [Lachnospiraceae bacterium]|nr:PLP-dependent aspartate aminotransferase family protein [Lachnospiraceae bacterium]
MGNYKNFDSALIHGGISSDPYTGSVNVPIYQTSTFQQRVPGDYKYEYSRTKNPTREALEALIAELDGGTHGFAFASGMAAITAVLSLFSQGDKILISNNVYGGTYRVLDKVFNHFGLTYRMVDTSDLTAVEEAITEDVKAVLVESPANPLLTITDLKGVGEIAHRHNLLYIVDNTFMSPYLQKPLELGADVVIYSATKYLGGHSDLVAGLVSVKDDELAERIAFIQNSTGGVQQPFDSFLLIRGIKTLAVRMERHIENATAVAKHLQENPAVKKVYFPGLPTAQGYEIQKAQAKGPGAMISFELEEGHDTNKFFESLQMIQLAESLGGVESLVCHPASMTHAAIPYETRQKVGITDGLIRFSVGIENIDDILQDLDLAIKESGK